MTAHSLRCGTGAVLGILLISACETGPPRQEAITVARVAEIRTARLPPHMEIRTTVKLHEKGRTMTPPAVTQKPGQTASLELIREFRYPVDFTLPIAPREEIMKVMKVKHPAEVAFPVTPTTPTEFASKPTGVQITISPRLEGGLVILKGQVTVTEFQGFTHAAGEVVARPIINSKEQPLLLTANKTDLAMFREAYTPIFVAALPGKTYTMQVAGAHGPMLVDFTCELVPEKK